MMSIKPTMFDLWPGGPADGLLQHGQPTVERQAPGPRNRSYLQATLVSQPTLTVYPAPADNNTGAAVVIYPGGGFQILSMELEGTDIAQFLNTMGVTAVIAQYRTAPSGTNWPIPDAMWDEIMAATLADGVQAVQVARWRATEWDVDPRRIGVMGFSAGGNVALRVLAQAPAASRPNFAILAYPGVRGELPELPAQTGPIFILNADDDEITPADGAVALYQALRTAKIPSELHIFRRGGHGFGLGEGPMAGWLKLVQLWLTDLKLL